VRRRCYLASPLGFTDAGRDYYRRVFLPALAPVVEPVDPWALTAPEEFDEARRSGRLRQLALTVGRRNVEAIRSCPLLAAYLDGQEVDGGTAAEIGYAAALGLRCFGLRGDLRQSGEEGVEVNLQLATFISDSGGRIVATLPELVDALADAAAQLDAEG
jgi:nucleoside 2-deoxyribosyltransferase